MEQFEVSLEVTQLPSVELTGYDELKELASQLASEMKQVTVTEDNVVASKKMVAQVRKRYSELDNQRKEAKKQLLAPLAESTEQLKELDSILKDGEHAVRTQISRIEQEAKEERKKVLENEFNRLADYYDLISAVTFDKVLDMKWLNKSTSEKRAKEELQDKINSIMKDYRLILSMVPDEDKTPCVYEFTKNGFDVNQVLESWKQKQEQLSILKKEVKLDSKKPKITIQPTHLEQQEVYNKTLVIYGRDDLNTVMKFMIDNNIHFKQL